MSKINFPKKQEQRLIPKHLLEYAEELQENHPDPSASWGGGSGGDYTAGEGIVIENNEISVDETVIATKQDLPDMNDYYTKTSANNKFVSKSNLTDYSIGEIIVGNSDIDSDNVDLKAVYSQDVKSEISADPTSIITRTMSGTDVSTIGISATEIDVTTPMFKYNQHEVATTDQLFSGNYNDLTNKPTIPDAVSGTNDGTNWTTITIGSTTKAIPSGGSTYSAGTGIDITNNKISIDNTVALKSELFSGNYNDLTNKPDLSVYAQTANLGTAAFIDEDRLVIDYSQLTNTPTIPTKTSDLTNDSGFITGVTWNDVTGKPTFATVATTGDYDDLTNKPTIPVVPTNISAFTNDAGYITGITSSDVTTALGYTPGTSNFDGAYSSLTGTPDLSIYAQSANLATVATTGAYSDLTGTPTIPAAVSGTNDGTNWTTLTIGSDTYAIGGGSTPSNMMTTDTAQNVTGVKTFVGDKLILFKGSSSTSKMGFTCYTSSGAENGYLESRVQSNVPKMYIGMYNTTNSNYDRLLGFKYQSKNNNTTYSYVLNCPTRLNDSTERTIPVRFQVGSTVVYADNTGLVDLTAAIQALINS